MEIWFLSPKWLLNPIIQKKPGWAEQDGNYFWEKLCEAINNLWKNGFSPEQIIGIGVTTQRATMLAVDKNGNPLRPAIVWLDQRKSRCYPPLGAYTLLFKLLGIHSSIKYFQDKAPINWIYKNEMDVWKNMYKYLSLSGYLNFKLTGEFKDSVANQVGYLPFDFKRHKWANGLDWKWKALMLKRYHLPDLVRPSELIGYVTEKASMDTGLKKNTPVYATASDKACEVLGCGCMDLDQGCLGYGTTATINVTSKKNI